MDRADCLDDALIATALFSRPENKAFSDRLASVHATLRIRNCVNILAGGFDRVTAVVIIDVERPSQSALSRPGIRHPPPYVKYNKFKARPSRPHFYYPPFRVHSQPNLYRDKKVLRHQFAAK